MSGAGPSATRTPLAPVPSLLGRGRRRSWPAADRVHISHISRLLGHPDCWRGSKAPSACSPRWATTSAERATSRAHRVGSVRRSAWSSTPRPPGSFATGFAGSAASRAPTNSSPHSPPTGSRRVPSPPPSTWTPSRSSSVFTPRRGVLQTFDLSLTPTCRRRRLPIGEIVSTVEEPLPAPPSGSPDRRLLQRRRQHHRPSRHVGSVALERQRPTDRHPLPRRFGDGATLLRLAAQLEQMRPWHNHIPPVTARDVATVSPR